MGYLTFASQFEASSATLSTKCRNLQHNLYLLEDLVRERMVSLWNFD